MKKSIYLQTTEIDVTRTVGEIQEILAQAGSTQILIERDIDTREVSSVSFTIFVSGKRIPFKLPCRYEPIFQAITKSRKVSASNPDRQNILKDKDLQQAKRIAWRQILYWLKAQLALIQTEMVKSQEVFLPYALVSKNETMFERLEKQDFKLLTGGKEE